MKQTIVFSLPRKRKRDKIIERICIAIIIFCFGLDIGFIIGIFFSTKEIKNDIKTVKTYNAKVAVTEDMPISWNSDNNFKPLDDCPLSEELQEYTYNLCQSYNIDFTIAMAIMCTESQFNINAVSSTQDYGIMQINVCNHNWLSEKLGLTDITNPYQNIRAGLFIYKSLYEKYESTERALMSYNLGERGATLLWEQGIHNSTYSDKVITKANEYKEQLNIKK